MTASMKRHDVSRIVVLSACGIGESREVVPRLLRPLLWFSGPYVREKEAMEAHLREGDLEWTALRPGFFREVRSSENWRAVVDNAIPLGAVPVVDVAACTLHAATTGAYARQAPVVGVPRG